MNGNTYMTIILILFSVFMFQCSSDQKTDLTFLSETDNIGLKGLIAFEPISEVDIQAFTALTTGSCPTHKSSNTQVGYNNNDSSFLIISKGISNLEKGTGNKIFGANGSYVAPVSKKGDVFNTNENPSFVGTESFGMYAIDKDGSNAKPGENILKLKGKLILEGEELDVVTFTTKIEMLFYNTFSVLKADYERLIERAPDSTKSPDFIFVMKNYAPLELDALNNISGVEFAKANKQLTLDSTGEDCLSK